MDLELLPVPNPPQSSVMAGAEIRPLTPAEIRALEPLLQSLGAELPDPQTSNFIGVVEDGKVLGFILLDLKLHASFYVAPGESAHFPRLCAETERFILAKAGPQWVYALPPPGRTSELAIAMGMEQEPANVFCKLVMPQTPKRTPILALDALDAPESAPGAPA